MERKLQQRLVGIFVLFAFLLLIAPVLLDGEGRIPEKITNIPPQPKRPDLSHIRVVEPSAPVLETRSTVEEADAEIAAFEQTPVVIEAQQDEEVAISGQQWSVQVASFKDVARASTLRDSLIDKGFKAYTREKTLSDGSLFTQVFVGPIANRPEADKLKSNIKNTVGLQGLVVKFL